MSSNTSENDIVFRLRKRAEIRRQIPGRKSVEEGKPDRIADILEEAATEIEFIRSEHSVACIMLDQLKKEIEILHDIHGQNK